MHLELYDNQIAKLEVRVRLCRPFIRIHTHVCCVARSTHKAYIVYTHAYTHMYNIPKQELEHLPNLTTLDMSYNLIKDMGPVKHCPKLEARALFLCIVGGFSYSVFRDGRTRMRSRASSFVP